MDVGPGDVAVKCSELMNIYSVTIVVAVTILTGVLVSQVVVKENMVVKMVRVTESY